MHSDDPDLQALRARNPDAFSRLVRTHTAGLLRGALALGFQPADAEELVQDTFVAFLEGLARFEGRSHLRTYLYGIMFHKGAALLRQRKREVATDDIEAVWEAQFDANGHWLPGRPGGPEQAVLSKEIATFIAACAENLTPTQRIAFHLREVEDRGPEEVCNILGVSDTNLRVLMHRARLRLRECLERKWGER